MSRSSRPSTVSEPLVQQRDGVTRLCVACLTLTRTPPAVVRSISVMVPLDAFPTSASSLVDLADQICAEYGLTVKAEFVGSYLVARLVRSLGQANMPRSA
jgi:hypothetical protein